MRPNLSPLRVRIFFSFLDSAVQLGVAAVWGPRLPNVKQPKLAPREKMELPFVVNAHLLHAALRGRAPSAGRETLQQRTTTATTPSTVIVKYVMKLIVPIAPYDFYDNGVISRSVVSRALVEIVPAAKNNYRLSDPREGENGCSRNHVMPAPSRPIRCPVPGVYRTVLYHAETRTPHRTMTRAVNREKQGITDTLH